MPFENESVWKEQIDEALLPFINSIVTPPKDTTLNVFIRKPDEDFKVETYPAISAYNLYDIPNYRRQPTPNHELVIKKDYDKNIAYLDEPAQFFDLLYQIDFWAAMQKHMNDMTRQWLAKTKRIINLDVRDMAGNEKNCPLLRQGNIQKADLLNGSYRIYHSFITYRAWVELDEATPTEEFLVKKIITKTKLI